MSNHLDQYKASTADWRKVIRKNNRRTFIIIAIFLLIYASVGILIDMYLYASSEPEATLYQLFIGVVTFQVFPMATLILVGIAAISLFVSFLLYDRLMLLGTNYHEVTASSQNAAEKQLYNIVEEMKIAAGIRYMPKVYIIDADYMNAFASGYSEKSAMIAITRGLMVKLNRDELQAVMAHELSHIRHLDIKLTITASLLTNLTVMVLDIFFYNAFFSNQRENSRSKNSIAGVIILLRYVLPLISVLLLLYLSRTRELMADAGCVELMRNNQPLAKALIKIHDDHIQNKEKYTAAYQRTPHENVRREAYIFDPFEAGIKDITSISDLFSTHPSLRARLASLGFKLKDTN